jgi:ATP-binding cassette subfamily F protein 3
VSLLAAQSVSLRFGPKVLFEDVDLVVDGGDRLGVVGPNGTGKSTLMRMLAGIQPPDGGEIRAVRGLRLGYLAQEHGEVGEARLVDYVLEGAPGKEVLEAEIAGLQAALEGSTDPDEQTELGGRLAELHESLADLEQRFGRHEAERIACGLGFEIADLVRPVSDFSGGWRMRAALARLLFERNDVLLLDEPTNHLDVPSIEWLTDFLQSSGQTLVLTSHDRTFLNRHIDRVASLEVEGLRTYRGNYDQYLEQREEELAFLEARWAKSEKRQRELEAFVTRFKAKASKARQAQSKQKLIEKMQAESVEIPKPRRALKIAFPPTKRTGDHVLRIEDVSFAYGVEPVLSDVSLTIQRQERIGLVGVNGAGKTTLLKLLAGELEPSKGRITLGAHVEPSYFAQHHADTLSDDQTVLEAVWTGHEELSQTQVRSICGAFLFSGDDVEKRVGVLSGGERARVALARILTRPGNLLLLDEPTNHLDTDAADALTESLAAYDGTVVFVSHSFRFIDRLATQLWDVGGGRVEPFDGTFSDYLERLRERQKALYSSGAAARPAGKTERMQAREAQKAKARDRRRLEREVEALEARVTALEARVGELEAELSKPETHADLDASRKLTQAYEATRRDRDAALEAWTEAQLQLESA